MPDRTSPADRAGRGPFAWAAGAGLLMAVCCAAPALIAVGALGAVGAAMAGSRLLGAAVLLPLLVVAGFVSHRTRCRARRHHGPDETGHPRGSDDG